MAVAAAEEVGWNVTYLGANLPAEEIGQSVRGLGVDAVAVGVVYLDDEGAAADEIRAIRKHVGAETPIIVGGVAATALAEVIDEVGGKLVGDIDEFGQQLGLIPRSR
jgi:hypothetical protein